MRTLSAAALLALTACAGTTPEEAETTAIGYQRAIAGACTVAMELAPLALPIAPYIIGGCATESAIAKLALNPTSLAWVNELVAKARRRA